MFAKALIIGALAPLAALAADVGGALHVGFSAFAAYPTTASDAAAAGWKRSDPGCDPVRALFFFCFSRSFWRHLGVIWASFASFSGILGVISRQFSVILCSFVFVLLLLLLCIF
jgi:hypothetical protein